MKNDKTVFCLPFESIGDLIEKVEKVKSTFLLEQKLNKRVLDTAGIKWMPVGEYGISIDLTGLPDDKFRLAESIILDAPHRTQEMLAEIGVFERQKG